MTLALELIEKEKIERTGKLDLGNCGLTDFPKEIFELDWLEELSICDEYWDAKNRQWIESENGGAGNYICNVQLPDAFSCFKELRVLRIGGSFNKNWRLRNGSVLFYLNSLTTLYLRFIEINEKYFLKKQSSITNIDLSFSEIKDYSFLESCTALTTLNLSFNEIYDYSFIEKLHGLTNLELSYNNIEDISFLKNLSALTILDLSDNKVCDAMILAELTGLTMLNLSFNKISDYSFFESLTNLTTLDLSFNKIKNLNFVGEMSSLKYLDLSDNELNNFNFLENLPVITNLNLSSNRISDISYLENYCDLINLNLSSNRISDISSLEYQQRLINLDLSSNQISDICSLRSLHLLIDLNLGFNDIKDIRFIENLTTLTNLNLCSNRVNNISYLDKLILLANLNLSHNEIYDYSSLENLTNLTHLDLSDNEINDYSFFKKLVSLISLDLRSNELSEIFFLEKLTKLEKLDLSYNQISDVTTIEYLSKLTNLNLQFNTIRDISFLQNLSSIKELNLQENEIENISFLKNLTTISRLDISANKISDYSSLAYLKSLKNLSLRSNGIYDCCILTQLPTLSNLDLRDNKIGDISFLVPLMQKGLMLGLEEYEGGINITNNTITNPPMNIVIQGTETVLDWFSQIDEGGALPFYESKLMILGQGGAGKTSFTNLLLDPDYKVKAGKGESTLGIAIHRGKEFAHIGNNIPKINANIWDFGGQDIQKMLHQFFITEECLYVLVSDKRAENTNFDYWFQIINMLGPNSSVIVLENPKEANGNNEDFPINKYQRLYPELDIDTIEVNLKYTRGKDNTKWAILNQLITDKLSELEVVNRMVPQKWGVVRKQLKALKKKKYITIEKFYELCAIPEVGFNERQADWCLSYFRSLGDLVYFDDRDLCTHIFLDQNWLTKGLYYILSDTSIKQDGGRFSQEQAFAKWEGNGYSKTEKAMLTKLLLKDKFDICYELPYRKNVFITPLLLTSDAPSMKWNHKTNLQFRFNYGFIPHGLFSRLIVQLHDKIDAEQPWKTGVRLKDIINGNEVYAEVQQFNDPKENQKVIDIKISGHKTGCKEMLANIRNSVDKLHKDFKNISVKQIVACNCDHCIKRMEQEEKPSFYDYEMLCDKVMHQSYSVDCERSKWKPVNIGKVLSDVIIENAAIENKDSQFFKYLKETGMSINKITNIAHGGNATSTSSSTSSAESTATNTVTITINNMLGEVQNLKEDFEEDKEEILEKVSKSEYNGALKDINKVEKAVTQLVSAQKENKDLPVRSMSRLKGILDDIGNEESTLHKGLKVLRKGRDYGVKMAELYNKVAENCGMPSVPPLALAVIKKI